MGELLYWLYFVSIPVALLATVAGLGWRFRRSIDSSIQKVGCESQTHKAMEQVGRARGPLVLRRVDTAQVGAATGQAAEVYSEGIWCKV